MPFGLCNAPTTFQMCMLAIFDDMIKESIEVFIDDFSVFGNSFDNCLNNLDKILQRCKDANLAFQRKIALYALNKERTETKIVKDGTEYCTEYRKEGHRREGCFKIIEYPDWWPGKKGDKPRGKAAYVETEISPIPGLSKDDYQTFLKQFSRTGNTESIKPTANMAQKESEQGIPSLLKEKENASSQGERK
nr:Gag-pre-integrase domain, Gag-polypeptide of LTR copia-type [Tanacetum cinerariifolium]